MTIFTSKKILPTTTSPQNDSANTEKNSNHLNSRENTVKKIRLSLDLIDTDRLKKIDEIKTKIQSGTYHVSSSDVAVALLRDLLKNIKNS